MLWVSLAAFSGGDALADVGSVCFVRTYRFANSAQRYLISQDREVIGKLGNRRRLCVETKPGPYHFEASLVIGDDIGEALLMPIAELVTGPKSYGDTWVGPAVAGETLVIQVDLLPYAQQMVMSMAADDLATKKSLRPAKAKHRLKTQLIPSPEGALTSGLPGVEDGLEWGNDL